MIVINVFAPSILATLSGESSGSNDEGADVLQKQRHRAGGEVPGQERRGPAHEVHLQRLREALRQQQRHSAAVARKGETRPDPSTLPWGRNAARLHGWSTYL